MGEALPEVTLLRDWRPSRPENAVGVGDFWYEPEVWDLPLSPASRVLYAGLCSYLGHGEINRRDLRNTLKDCSDEEISAAIEELARQDCSDEKISAALEELARHNLLLPRPDPGDGRIGFAVLPVKGYA